VITGDLLREARKRAGLTQAELGRRVGRPQSVIGRWERSEVAPSLETLRELIRACGLELSFRLATRDDSYVPHIERMLDMEPAQRVRHAARRANANRRIRGRAGAARDG
jgi:transcriptional regulator with XRE-family HTH domain